MAAIPAAAAAAAAAAEDGLSGVPRPLQGGSQTEPGSPGDRTQRSSPQRHLCSRADLTAQHRMHSPPPSGCHLVAPTRSWPSDRAFRGAAAVAAVAVAGVHAAATSASGLRAEGTAAADRMAPSTAP
eukprot:357324-Chlamydomonas_euryale.AAC.2